MRKDFEYLSGLVGDFFKQSRIGRSLNIIEENEITGWEVWFQIEFAHFLSQHDTSPEWLREHTLKFDRRMEKLRTSCRPDFIIRKKGWKIDSFVALEIKQHPNAKTCVNNMFKDIEKIFKVKDSELDTRSFWVLGVHKTPKEDLSKYISECFDAGKLEFSQKLLVTNNISKTGFSYSLF